MKKHNLAIIIPYFKIIYFEKTLESLAQQTDQRFHVYIGDDASPNSPEALLNKYQGKFNFTYKRFENNLGSLSLTKQWERCIAMSSHEAWFMILGDDDFLSSNVIEEFYRHIDFAEENNIKVIKCNSLEIDEKGEVMKTKKEEPVVKSSIDHFFDKFVYEGRSSLTEHFYKREAYEKYGFYDMPLAWHSDDLSQLQFSEFGSILFLKEAICNVRVSNSSITGDKGSIRTKQISTQIFFEELGKNIKRFKGINLQKFLHLVYWAEEQKDIKIYIKNKYWYYIKAFGIKGNYFYLKTKKR